MHASCSADHESIVALRTKLTCTPRDRCTPEQLRQRKMPWLTDAQSGFVVEQSAHVRLVSSCDSAWRIFRASGFVISNTRAFRSGPSASDASFAFDAVGSTSKFRSPVDDFLIAFTVRYSSMQVGLDQSREVLHSTHFVDTRFHARARERGRVDTGKRKSARPVGTFVCFLDVVGLGTTRAWVINQSINQSFGLELAVVNRRIETPSVNRRRR